MLPQTDHEAKDLQFELIAFGLKVVKCRTQRAPECWCLWPQTLNVTVCVRFDSRKAIAHFAENVTRRTLTIRGIIMVTSLPIIEETLVAIRVLER